MAKEWIHAHIKMYNMNEETTDDQLNQFAIQLLQDKEQANRLFEEAKALKVFNYLKENVKLNTKEIDYVDFEKLDK
ncbi:hypothetical protein UE99_040955 [Burkholderia cenocepacia]|nr:hypothetical protein [Burkholderia cenocepacia]MCW3709626.1 hypothetical protein [Burkholderia cenocepacia]